MPNKSQQEEPEEKVTRLTINSHSSTISTDSIANSISLYSSANFSYKKELRDSFKSKIIRTHFNNKKTSQIRRNFREQLCKKIHFVQLFYRTINSQHIRQESKKIPELFTIWRFLKSQPEEENQCCCMHWLMRSTGQFSGSR